MSAPFPTIPMDDPDIRIVECIQWYYGWGFTLVASRPRWEQKCGGPGEVGDIVRMGGLFFKIAHCKAFDVDDDEVDMLGIELQQDRSFLTPADVRDAGLPV